MMMMDVLLFVGLVQQPARMIAGRARPELGEGHFSFKPFTTANERASFISGHAWSAFGISNIVARQIDQAISPLAGIAADAYQIGLPYVRSAIAQAVSEQQYEIIAAAFGVLLLVLLLVFRKTSAASVSYTHLTLPTKIV